MKLFLVDDSPQVIERLKEMLAPIKGIEIIGYAHDIPEALVAIQRGIPDVVLLDLNLPSGTGIEVLRTIRKEMPAITVIVLTNYAFPQYKKRCLALGAYAFLDKSTEVTNVPQLIQALADSASHTAAPRSPQEAVPTTKVVSR